MSGENIVGTGLDKTKSLLVTWGIPAVGVIVGIVLGDTISIGKWLNDLLPLKLGDKAMGVISAAIYAVIGVLVYGHFGIIGHFIGALFLGMALGTVYQALTGKALVIPGFSSGMVA